MATSPIYSWPEPDNTDLVKNGALAMRTLGDAIDTTMATMTPKSIVDAKGDLIAASANDTPARLAVGANGETLVADSVATTGLRWQVPVNANPTLNSAMQVWQRGTSFSFAASTAYTSGFTADRWQTATGANQACTISRQATGDTTNLPNIQYALRYQRNSGQTGVTGLLLAQNFESINAIPYAGKTVQVSFYARKGADFSGSIAVRLFTGTGTDQNIFSTYTGVTSVLNSAATLTTTWQRFTRTATLGATATEMALRFDWTPSGTAGAADYYEVTGVQIEVGEVATPFKTYAGTIQGELAACQRYYIRYITNVSGGSLSPLGYATSTTQTAAPVSFPVEMRINPTVLDYANAGYYSTTGYTTGTTTIGEASSAKMVQVRYTHGTAVFTAGASVGVMYSTSTSAGYLGYSAEL